MLLERFINLKNSKFGYHDTSTHNCRFWIELKRKWRESKIPASAK